MANSTRFVSVLSTLVFLAGGANAETFIVDQAGGAGYDFLDVQPAIDAATHGDLIIVRSGSYGGFHLTLGLTILGSVPSESNVSVGMVTITDVPSPERAVLSSLQMGWTTISNNPGHVILDSVNVNAYPNSLTSLAVANCADVRLYQCTVRAGTTAPSSPAPDAVAVWGSRFEAIECSFRGAWGYGTGCEGFTFVGGDGGTGMIASQGSSVALFRTSILGGSGGNGWTSCKPADYYGGNGGNGLLLLGGSSAVIAGLGADTLRHGSAGTGSCMVTCPNDGIDGTALILQDLSTARYSGTMITSQSVQAGSSVVPAVPDDPFLERLGVLQAGSLQQFWVRGTPGAAVTLFLGRGPTITVDSTQEMDYLVSQERAFNLGVLPPSGRKMFSFVIPASFPTGFTFFAQAMVTPQVGQQRLTNSLPVVIRD